MDKLNLKNPEVWHLMERVIEGTLDADNRKILDRLILENDLKPLIDRINSAVSRLNIEFAGVGQITILFTYHDQPSSEEKQIEAIANRLSNHRLHSSKDGLTHALHPTGYYDKRKEDENLWTLILCYYSFLNPTAVESKCSFSLLLSKEDRNQSDSNNGKMIRSTIWETMLAMVGGNMNYIPSAIVNNCNKFLGKPYLELVRNQAKDFNVTIQSEMQGDNILLHVGTENPDFIKLLVDGFIIDGNDITGNHKPQVVRGDNVFVMAIYHHIANVITTRFVIDPDKNLSQFRNPDEPRVIAAEPKFNAKAQSLIVHRTNKLIGVLKGILDGYAVDYSSRLLDDDIHDLNHHIEHLFGYLTSYNVGFARNPSLIKSLVRNEPHALEITLDLIHQLNTHLEKLLEPEFINGPDILYYSYLNELDLKTSLVLSAIGTH